METGERKWESEEFVRGGRVKRDGEGGNQGRGTTDEERKWK